MPGWFFFMGFPPEELSYPSRPWHRRCKFFIDMERTQPTDAPPRVSFVTLALITAALYFGRDVLIPLALAVLISFILTPSVQRLQQMRLGRVPAVLLVVVLAFGAVPP